MSDTVIVVMCFVAMGVFLVIDGFRKIRRDPEIGVLEVGFGLVLGFGIMLIGGIM